MAVQRPTQTQQCPPRPAQSQAPNHRQQPAPLLGPSAQAPSLAQQQDPMRRQRLSGSAAQPAICQIRNTGKATSTSPSAACVPPALVQTTTLQNRMGALSLQYPSAAYVQVERRAAIAPAQQRKAIPVTDTKVHTYGAQTCERISTTQPGAYSSTYQQPTLMNTASVHCSMASNTVTDPATTEADEDYRGEFWAMSPSMEQDLAQEEPLPHGQPPSLPYVPIMRNIEEQRPQPANALCLSGTYTDQTGQPCGHNLYYTVCDFETRHFIGRRCFPRIDTPHIYTHRLTNCETFERNTARAWNMYHPISNAALLMADPLLLARALGILDHTSHVDNPQNWVTRMMSVFIRAGFFEDPLEVKWIVRAREVSRRRIRQYLFGQQGSMS
jgi:hypothetical protein